MMLPIVGLALVALFAGDAAAQGSGIDALKRLEAYIDTAEYRAYVTARLHEYEAAPLRAECPTLRLIKRADMWVIDEPKFAAGAIVPTTGAWSDRLIVDRCGTTVYRNLLLVARQQQPQASALLPGRTFTPPKVQRDALKPAAAQARIKTGCQDDMHVSDTVIEGRVKPGSPWKEDWTFVGCGKTVVVGLTFTPSADGAAKVTARAK
jgi:hypothetical protein